MTAGRTLLAGDIGASNIRLALFREEAGTLIPGWSARYRVTDFQGVGDALERFVLEAMEAGTYGPVDAAAFGVAGAVRDSRVVSSHLPWPLDASLLAAPLRLPTVVVVNDLMVNALGLGELASTDFALLNEGVEDPDGNAVLVSPGTGLGVSILVRDGSGFRPIPSEGGSVAFAPRGRIEVELLEFLSAEFGHVACERILSGPGLVNLYRFERSRSEEPEPLWLRGRMTALGDAAPAITEAALAERDAVCQRTLERFVSILGSQAGNVALTGLATGGVYLGGGIPPRILPKLLEGSFFAAFCDRGRFGPILSRMPVRVVLNDRCALLGAARAAATAR